MTPALSLVSPDPSLCQSPKPSGMIETCLVTGQSFPECFEKDAAQQTKRFREHPVRKPHQLQLNKYMKIIIIQKMSGATTSCMKCAKGVLHRVGCDRAISHILSELQKSHLVSFMFFTLIFTPVNPQQSSRQLCSVHPFISESGHSMPLA